MLEAIGVTHVVSVGESLIQCAADWDPSYGAMGGNTLCAAAQAGRIQVCVSSTHLSMRLISRLDLTGIRDDGNDPLRPMIARAVEWIEEARQSGGTVLVHCVSWRFREVDCLVPHG